MDKHTLSHYGWIVIVSIIMAVMMALASPFGKYVGQGASQIVMAYKNASEKAKENIPEMEDMWENELTKQKIPNDGTYIQYINGQYDKTTGEFTYDEKITYTDQNFFPAEVNFGDTYIYGDYIYRYNMSYEIRDGEERWRENSHLSNISLTTGGNIHTVPLADGWGVRVKENKEQYGKIEEMINNEPVTNLAYTFAKTNAREVVEFPKYTVALYATYHNCPNITTIPSLTYLEYLKDMRSTFGKCINLTTLEGISFPNNEGIQLYQVFKNCEKLQNGWDIPENVEMMHGVYSGCKSLTGIITINSRVNDYLKMQQLFQNTEKEIFVTGTNSQIEKMQRIYENVGYIAP